MPSVQGIFFKDIKQTLRKEQCDVSMFTTCNVFTLYFVDFILLCGFMDETRTIFFSLKKQNMNGSFLYVWYITNFGPVILCSGNFQVTDYHF